MLDEQSFDLFGASIARRNHHHSIGQKRKLSGQFKVCASNDGWLSTMLDHLPAFLSASRKSDDGFRMEQFRGYVKSKGLADPAHVNAWGALTTAAQRVGMIRWTGRFGVAMNPSAHARIVKVWEAAR